MVPWNSNCADHLIELVQEPPPQGHVNIEALEMLDDSQFCLRNRMLGKELMHSLVCLTVLEPLHAAKQSAKGILWNGFAQAIPIRADKLPYRLAVPSVRESDLEHGTSVLAADAAVECALTQVGDRPVVVEAGQGEEVAALDLR